MNKLTVGVLSVGVTLLAGCGGGGSSSDIDLYRVGDVTIDSLGTIDRRSDIADAETAMSEFSKEFHNQLNASQPLVHPTGAVGVKDQDDGSFIGFNDKDNNNMKDAGEDELFMVELDTENQRVIISKDGEVASSAFTGLLAGAAMGMLMGNLLNRQRAAGANPAQKKANTTRAAQSAKSRAGSGSHSRGK